MPTKYSKEEKGKDGEERTKIYAWFILDRKIYKRIHGVILQTPSGSTQIDHIFLSRFGIFVVESKNMKGIIHCDPEADEWHQELNKKYPFRNPLKQNAYHIEHLAKLLNIEESELISIVVFTGTATLRGNIPDNVEQGRSFIGHIESFRKRIYTDTQVDKFVKKIKQARIPKRLARRQQPQPVRQPDKAMPKKAKQTEQTPACPKCKQPMVKRQATKGKRKGKELWGCSTYPKCKATINIE
ncbi:MAG: NERD domain-containing protein [Candidatus Porifericomitaceae bacterium WSBS_2022_MAG_OTU9]